MKKSKIMAFLMSVLMMISMLPAMVFAESPATALEGELKIKGTIAAESTLQADYTKVKPEGLTDDDVSFLWQRKVSDSAEEPLVDLGKEKTYKATSEDIGYKIVLTITGREDRGYTGTLTATSEAVTEAVIDESTGEAVPEENYEEPSEEVLPEENYEEQSEEVLPEESYEEVLPEENYEEQPEEVLPEENYGEASEELFPVGEVQEEVYNNEESYYSEELTPVEEPTQEENYHEEELTPVEESGESQEMYYGNEELTPVENTESEENVSYNLEGYAEDGTNVVDFGTIQIGSENSVEPQYVSVKNSGTGTLNFEGITPEHFRVDDIIEPLEAGEGISLAIRPREGIEAGTYEDTISYKSDQLVEVSFVAKVVVAAAADEENNTEATDPGQDPVDPENPENTENPADPENPEDPATPENPENPEDPATPENPENPEDPATPENPENPENPEDPATPENPENPDDPANPENPENPDDPQPPVEPVRSLAVSADSLDFGAVTEGYEELPAAQKVTFTNTGNVDLTLDTLLFENGYFAVGEFAPVTLGAEESVDVFVQPVSGLLAETYADTLTVYSDRMSENGEAEILASVTATLQVEKKSIHKLTVIPAEVDFGSITEGYQEAPKAQKVTITNDGNETEILYQPEGDCFVAGELSRTELKPGETSEFTIRPVQGLERGDYLEPIYIANDSEQEICVTASVTVSKKKEDTSVKLTGIQKPAEITGLPNGTEKKAEALKLPGTVILETTKGTKKAKVAWDVKGCAYDPSSTAAQSFNVKGKVTLPDGIKNPNEISLITSVKVSVNGYTANVVSADGNKITGITPNGQYTTKSTISFTAVGAGMDNESPRKGDVRYLPLNWTVVNTNTWSSAPYAASFGMGRSGSYTLSVVFARQQYDGSNWVNTGEQDTKQVSFSIVKAVDPTVTPTPGANQRRAVQTGDDTPIVPLVIALIVAVALIAGVIIYRRRR